MTRAEILSTAAILVLLIAAALVVIVAWIARDGGDDWEPYEYGDFEDGPADYDPARYYAELDEDPFPCCSTGEEYEPRTLAADWAQQLQAPEVPELDPCTAQPYVDYTPRHATETVELFKRPDGWCPAVGQRRLAAALDSTQQFEAVQA